MSQDSKKESIDVAEILLELEKSNVNPSVT
jgi:hypothetical protein